MGEFGLLYGLDKAQKAHKAHTRAKMLFTFSCSFIGCSVSGSETHPSSSCTVWVASDTFFSQFTCTCTSTVLVGAARGLSVCVATVAIRRCLTLYTTFSVALLISFCSSLLRRSVSILVWIWFYWALVFRALAASMVAFSVQLAQKFELCSPQHPRSYVLVVRIFLRLRAPHARRGRAAQSLLSAVVAFSYPLLLRVLVLRLPSMG